MLERGVLWRSVRKIKKKKADRKARIVHDWRIRTDNEHFWLCSTFCLLSESCFYLWVDLRTSGGTPFGIFLQSGSSGSFDSTPCHREGLLKSRWQLLRWIRARRPYFSWVWLLIFTSEKSGNFFGSTVVMEFLEKIDNDLRLIAWH